MAARDGFASGRARRRRSRNTTALSGRRCQVFHRVRHHGIAHRGRGDPESDVTGRALQRYPHLPQESAILLPAAGREVRRPGPQMAIASDRGDLSHPVARSRGIRRMATVARGGITGDDTSGTLRISSFMSVFLCCAAAVAMAFYLEGQNLSESAGGISRADIAGNNDQ